jgi:selenide, water dikinase
VDPDVLVGIATSDDAAVYRFGDQALVATVDVFTPVVDDPFDFGRIAAANALSDVYAMGARPLFALSIIGFPVRTLPLEIMTTILRGGVAGCAEAGIAVVGGHSIDDAEPKYGLAVVGVADPARLTRNSTARPGDVLVLTKPIGTGVISQGIKSGAAPPEALAAAVASMAALNRAASDAMLEVGVSAATDVTGFGLLGHLHEMVHASGLGARLDSAAVPLLPGARELAAAGVMPGGSRRNADWFGRWVRFAARVDPALRVLLADAQTSGGLLIAVPGGRAPALREALSRRGVLDAVIGELGEGPAGEITVD